MSIAELTIHEIHTKLKRKEFSSLELTQECLKRIKELEPRLNSFITVSEELALAQAKEADALITKTNDFAALTGVPLGIKDIFLVEGMKTTCASKILGNFIAPYTASSVQNLLQHKPVILGKLNMDEFAMGSSNETSAYGPTRNPWNTSTVPGGSSGGSAAAVAASQCIAATGTDTGGSIRQPASLSGIVGLKPTYGRVSRYGVIAFASSLDQVGPMTKDVRDCAILLKALAGHDPKDSTSQKCPVPDYPSLLGKGIRGLKIGIPKEYSGEGVHIEVASAIESAKKDMEKLGAQCLPVSLPHTRYAVPTYYIIAPAEASSNLSRYDGIRYGLRQAESSDLLDLYKKTRAKGFGREVQRRIMLGTYALSAGYYDAYYLKAMKVRTLIRRDFEEAFKQCDILLTPTSPTPAWPLGEKVSDPLQMYLSDVMTINVNLAGLPGMSLPCGFTKSKLPIGMQLIGNYFKEEILLNAAHAYEQATEWHLQRPPL